MVHASIISAEQLDAALRQQVVYGGRLGTNLIELGYANQDQIAHGLARVHGVPAALARHLTQHDSAVLELLPATLAAKFSAFPIAYSMSNGRRLVVCMRDPALPGALVEMSQVGQLTIVPCVAPELAVFYWLERCYDIPRARRYAYAQPGSTSPLPRSSSDHMPAVQAPVDEDEFDIDMDEEPDMADMLQLVDLDHSQVTKDHSAYDVGKVRATGLDLVERRPGSDTSPAPRFTLRGPTPAPAPPAPLASPAPSAPPAPAPAAPVAATQVAGPVTVRDQSVQPPLPSLPTAIQPPPPLRVAPKMTLDEAERAIAAATKRDEVMNAIIAYMHGVFGAGLALIIKDELALGLRGFGGTFDETSVETIVLPLSAQSFFCTTYENKKLFHGAPGTGHLQDRFFKLFGGAPEEVLVVPVVLRDRIVCMFYGHARDKKSIPHQRVAELGKLAHKTEQAFIRLIRGSKKPT